MLIFVFAFISDRPVMRFLTGQFFSPLFKAGNFFYGNLSRIPIFFYDTNKLIEENRRLLHEVESNRLDLIDYESVKYENQRLREQLKIRPVENFITASIIAKSPQIPLDSLFLDKGTSEGVSNGDLVLAGEKVLIGRVARADKNRTTAVLNSSAGIVSYGYLVRTDEPLETKGAGGGGMETRVPIDFDIVVGDRIMSGGLPGYLVAVVEAIEEDYSSGFKDVLMSLPVNVLKINVVFIKPAADE